MNEGIRETLYSGTPGNFYFFNNGLTLVCSDFSYNALQGSDYQVNLDHRTMGRAQALIEERGERYFTASVEDVQWALKRLYGEQPVSMQQLSATFRRGDLIRWLQNRERREGWDRSDVYGRIG